MSPFHHELVGGFIIHVGYVEFYNKISQEYSHVLITKKFEHAYFLASWVEAVLRAINNMRTEARSTIWLGVQLEYFWTV